MEERTKICPFCREEISIFARKCRYCNEKVADSLRHEERTLTVDDIGRPDQDKTIHGASLVKAYETLRAELKQRTDTIHNERRRKLINLQKVKSIIGWLVVIGIFASPVVFRASIARFFRHRGEVRIRTEARSVLQEASQAEVSGDPVGAMRLAKQALVLRPGNDLAEAMLDRLRTDIKERLERMYSGRNYEGVMYLADRVLDVDPENKAIMRLAKRAQEDKSRFSLWVDAIIEDSSGGKCIAIIRSRRWGKIEVSEGDIFQDMKVLKINGDNSTVSLFDTMRNVKLRVTDRGCFFEE